MYRKRKLFQAQWWLYAKCIGWNLVIYACLPPFMLNELNLCFKMCFYYKAFYPERSFLNSRCASWVIVAEVYMICPAQNIKWGNCSIMQSDTFNTKHKIYPQQLNPNFYFGSLFMRWIEQKLNKWYIHKRIKQDWNNVNMVCCHERISLDEILYVTCIVKVRKISTWPSEAQNMESCSWPAVSQIASSKARW